VGLADQDQLGVGGLRMMIDRTGRARIMTMQPTRVEEQRVASIANPIRRVRVALAAGLLVIAGSPGTAQADYDQTRTSSFTYYQASDGVRNGLLKTEVIEPGNPQLCVTTSYDYDAYGNRKTATTSACAGASGNALFAARTSTSTYAAQGTGTPAPAGAFATTSSNALSQSDQKSYDPRFGAVVALIGPNALPTSWTLDDFGRAIVESHADGTQTRTFYCLIPGRVTDPGSSTPGCPAPAGVEVPNDAVAFVHSVSTTGGGTPIGPFSRVYTDRAGHKIRSVTEAYDGPDQPGGGARLIVQDTDFSPYGPALVTTQPYFLDTGSSTAGGFAHYGMSRTDYDVLGRPTAIYTADIAATGNQGGNAGNIDFGSRGYVQASRNTIEYKALSTKTTDDQDKTRLEEKNADGKVVRITDHLGAQVAHQHDAFGNLLATKDALQNRVAIAYDARGRKTSMTDPDAGVWAYCYDALGQLVAQQNSKMRGSDSPGPCPGAPNNPDTATALAVPGWTTMAYDKLARLASRVEPEYATAWTYDSCFKGVGKLCEVNTSTGVNRKSVYDALGRPSSSRTTIASGPSFASAVAYDPIKAWPLSQTYPSGLKVVYDRTDRGFVKSLSTGTPITLAPLPATAGGTPGALVAIGANTTIWRADSYNAWGKVELQTYGNSVATRAAFDPTTGRLTGVTAGAGGATGVVNHQYLWDSIGHLTHRDDNNGDGLLGAVSDDFGYDALGRLASYKVSAPGIPAVGNSRTVTLQYNALGMLLYKSDVGNYVYGAQNTPGIRPHALQRLVGSAGTTTYTYDANGNLRTADAGKYRSIAYTSFNLPGNDLALPDASNGLQGPAGSPKYTWQYDENHQRVKEIETGSAGTRTTWMAHPDNAGGLGFEREEWSTGPNAGAASNRHYLNAGGTTIGVLVSTGALPTLLPTDMAPPSNLASIALVKVEFWHKDHLGSLIATTDHTGAVTARYAYDPFGKRRDVKGTYDAFGAIVVDWSTNTNNGTDRGYTGHEHLDDVGIIHMNGRIFDPTLGRFLQPDPFIQDPANLQNFDRFGYCYNNPLTCTDPSGFSAWTRLRNFVIRVVAAVADYYGCSGYCSASVAAYQSYQAGAGWGGAITSGIAAYVGYSVGGADFSTQVVANAATGCLGALAGHENCARGAVGGVIRTYGADYGFFGQVIAGCVSGRVTGGTCRSGAEGAVEGYLQGKAVDYIVSSANSSSQRRTPSSDDPILLACDGPTCPLPVSAGRRSASSDPTSALYVLIWGSGWYNGEFQVGHVMVMNYQGDLVESQFPLKSRPWGQPNDTRTPVDTIVAEGRAPDAVYLIETYGFEESRALAKGRIEQQKTWWSLVSFMTDNTNCSVAARNVLVDLVPSLNFHSPSPWSIRDTLNMEANTAGSRVKKLTQ
jgi:RHS repeat-associated protein